MIKHYLTILFILMNMFAFNGLLLAQTKVPGSRVSGIVLDEAKKPLDFATVSLLNAPDSILIRTAVSGLDGKFAFENVAAGTYRVNISMVGYAKTRTSDFSI